MAVSIADVAEYAGVSTATVSRVLSDKPHVSERTRQRVLKAVHELNYQPNRTARRLRSQSSDVLGLIVSDIQNPYFTAVARGVEDAAFAKRMNVLLCNTDEDIERERIYLNLMRAEDVAGFIISPAHTLHNRALLQEIRQSGLAIVLLDRQYDGFECDTVLVDNIKGTRIAIDHLVQTGYTKIAMIGGGSYITSAKERYEGFHDAIAANNLVLHSEFVKVGNFKRESGYRLARELIELPHPPEAIFVANNQMLLGVLAVLREAQINIPEDIAIIGFDDTPWANEITPPITVVAQPTYQLGSESLRLLRRRINDPDAPHLISRLDTELVIRESCGARLNFSNSSHIEHL